MTAICAKCQERMQKKKTLMMSNTKYEVYKCPRCDAEKSICLGVAN